VAKPRLCTLNNAENPFGTAGGLTHCNIFFCSNCLVKILFHKLQWQEKLLDMDSPQVRWHIYALPRDGAFAEPQD